ncbi:hypothetical protein F503_01763 [Ophiostoma piceae UAMH 11346]|uniref:Cyclin-D1-binding protein 1-like N-terminal domain-containing protein n=1 Tax=Ophiostoma piceae (strain UAMH 11346) TaxID=1262450 RepID=S3CC57_OPHP1|nr:hypothetical protein F503_01763 [Ophiostoma piceae UAMH 11346]
MAPSAPADKAAVDALNAQLDSALVVIQQFSAFVKGVFAEAAKLKSVQTAEATPASSGSTKWEPATEIDALALARDAATLSRAHGTKISLLIINEPFTPSAIGTVVRELVSGPVPALAKAAEVCYADRYTHHVRQELARRCGSVLDQMHQLFMAIPRDGRVVPESERRGGVSKVNKAQSDRGSYAKIGILWAECDALVAFANRGVGGHFVQVVNEVADMLKDEQEELKEWGDEEDDDDDDDDDVDDSGYDDGEEDDDPTDTGGNSHNATQAILDAMMSTRHIPPDDPEGLRPRLDSAVKKIRLVVLLCRAVVKRRLNKLPSSLPTKTPSDIAPRLDGSIVALKTISDRFEDLAAAFYKLSVVEVDAAMGECFAAAVSASAQLRRPWTGDADAKDEFTDWVAKFQTEMKVTAL